MKRTQKAWKICLMDCPTDRPEIPENCADMERLILTPGRGKTTLSNIEYLVRKSAENGYYYLISETAAELLRTLPIGSIYIESTDRELPDLAAEVTRELNEAKKLPTEIDAMQSVIQRIESLERTCDMILHTERKAEQERDEALAERDKARAERDEALAERDEARKYMDDAIKEQDITLSEMEDLQQRYDELKRKMNLRKQLDEKIDQLYGDEE